MATQEFTPAGHGWRYVKKLGMFDAEERDALASAALVLLDQLNAGAFVVSQRPGSNPRNAATLLLRLNLLEESLYGARDPAAVRSRLDAVVDAACKLYSAERIVT